MLTDNNILRVVGVPGSGKSVYAIGEADKAIDNGEEVILLLTDRTDPKQYSKYDTESFTTYGEEKVLKKLEELLERARVRNHNSPPMLVVIDRLESFGKFEWDGWGGEDQETKEKLAKTLSQLLTESPKSNIKIIGTQTVAKLNSPELKNFTNSPTLILGLPLAKNYLTEHGITNENEIEPLNLREAQTFTDALYLRDGEVEKVTIPLKNF